jgi:hypothetical protein
MFFFLKIVQFRSTVPLFTCQVNMFFFPKDSSIPFRISFIYVNQTGIVGLSLHGQSFTLFTCYF